MDYNLSEMEIALKLKEMKKKKRYIALQLHPPIGDSTIRREGNRMFINEGRDGKWEDVRESFFNNMVNVYDSRVK
jgi:hypothetical protein